jgi:hypothetical protein
MNIDKVDDLEENLLSFDFSKVDLKKWYKKTQDYWNNVTPNVSGMVYFC